MVFFSNQRVDPTLDYTYDPTYRLARATGREHLGQGGGGALLPSVQTTNDDSVRMTSAPGARLINPSDGNAMGLYTETYSYDAVGNFLQMVHQVASGGWTTRYAYQETSQVTPSEINNRLSATSLPGDAPLGPYSAAYTYDAHGSMTAIARNFGTTKKATGSSAMVFSASSSSVTRMVPISAAKAEPDLPITTIAVTSGPNSRVMEIATRLGTNCMAPILCNW